MPNNDCVLPGHLSVLIFRMTIENFEPLLGVDISTMSACVGLVAVFLVLLYAHECEGWNESLIMHGILQLYSKRIHKCFVGLKLP